MRRRIFVGSVFAGLAAVRRARPAPAGDIPRRVFGKTGERLTIIGVAGGRFGNCEDFETAKRIVRRGYDLGVNYFDNARVYWNGRSEEVFGAVIPEFRKNVFVTSKSHQRTRQEAEAELHESLRLMKTDYLDLWQIHSVTSLEDVDKVFAPGGAIEAFEAAKKAGKTRFIGFTGHTDPAAHFEMLKRYKDFDTIFMPLHAADPHYLSFEKLVLPEAVKQNLGIQAMKTTGVGKLLGKLSLEQCLRYSLSLPIHCAAMGATTVEQIEADAEVARRFQRLGESEMAGLRARAESLAGPELENWKRKPEQAGSRFPAYTGG